MEFHEFGMDYLKKALPVVAEREMNIKIRTMKFIGGGSYGKVFKTETEDGKIFALKAYRRKGLNEREAFQLKVLSENTDVPMPQVLSSYSDDNISFLAMSFIEGQNVLSPVYMLFGKKKKQAFAENVVKGMLQWHSVKGEKFGDLENPSYDSWYDFYRTEIVEGVLQFTRDMAARGKLPESEYALLKKATEVYDRLGDEAEYPVLIHGDLNIMNIMADSKTFRLTGFIDPCDSMWANPEYDLYQLRNMWGDMYGLYDTYKKYAVLSDNCDFKIAYYGFVNEIKCFRNSGEDFAIWRGIWSRRLKKELSKIENC